MSKKRGGPWRTPVPEIDEERLLDICLSHVKKAGEAGAFALGRCMQTEASHAVKGAALADLLYLLEEFHKVSPSLEFKYSTLKFLGQVEGREPAAVAAIFPEGSGWKAELLGYTDGMTLGDSVASALELLEEGGLSDRVLYGDNHVGSSVAGVPRWPWRTRHLRLRSFVLRERVGLNIWWGRHVPGTQLAADLLTKAVVAATSWLKFRWFMWMILNEESRKGPWSWSRPRLGDLYKGSQCGVGHGGSFRSTTSLETTSKVAKMACAAGASALVAWLAQQVGREDFTRAGHKSIGPSRTADPRDEAPKEWADPDPPVQGHWRGWTFFRLVESNQNVMSSSRIPGLQPDVIEWNPPAVWEIVFKSTQGPRWTHREIAGSLGLNVDEQVWCWTKAIENCASTFRQYQNASRKKVSDGDLWGFLHGRPTESLPDEVPGDDELYNEAIESETETSDGDFSCKVTDVAATP
eukprot:s3503_g5.t1